MSSLSQVVATSALKIKQKKNQNRKQKKNGSINQISYIFRFPININILPKTKGHKNFNTNRFFDYCKKSRFSTHIICNTAYLD